MVFCAYVLFALLAWWGTAALPGFIVVAIIGAISGAALSEGEWAWGVPVGIVVSLLIGWGAYAWLAVPFAGLAYH